jgi:O-antigen/teichoic acid export membrane protein
VLAAATTVANAMGYGLVLLLARTMPADQLGAAGALLNLLVIGTVPALAVQLVAARLVATAPAVRESGALARADLLAERPAVLGVGLEVGVALAAAVALVSPLLGRFLHLGGPWSPLLVGLCLIPTTLVYAVQGILQGRQRFLALAAVLVVAAAARPLAGIATWSLGGGITGLTALIGLGTLGAAVFSGRLVGMRWRRLVPGAGAASGRRRSLGLVPGAAGLRGQVVAASVSTAGLLTFANVDVVLARHVLGAGPSGAYAAGAIFAKIALWAPQFVSTLLFPQMTDRARRASAVAGALAVCLAVGALAVAVSSLFGPELVVMVVGERYASLGAIVSLFTALGAMLAVAQVLVYSRLAVGDRRLGVIAWGCVAAFVVAVVTDPAPSTGGVAVRALAAATVLAGCGLLAERAALASVIRRIGPRAGRHPSDAAPPAGRADGDQGTAMDHRAGMGRRGGRGFIR